MAKTGISNMNNIERPSIYLDYNASTPIAPEVISEMQPFLKESYGNPSSAHWASQGALSKLEEARQRVARSINCRPDEIIFTSGGSESNNAVLKGLFLASLGEPFHIVTSKIEHDSITAPCQFLEKLGAEVTRVDVDRFGLVEPQSVADAIRPHTCLITIMQANNEVGTIQPIPEIAMIAQENSVLLHTDAAQTLGKIKTDVTALGVDYLTIVGHKMYAPKGIGALYVRNGAPFEALVHGGGHESGRRSGTESILMSVALGKACELAKSRMASVPEIERLRDLLWTLLSEAFGDEVALNGHPKLRLPNTLNVSFRNHKGFEILAQLPHIAASTGSACHTGSDIVSPVLAAMGIETDLAAGAIRFSLGFDTTESEIRQAAQDILDVIQIGSLLPASLMQ
jgi:cysteine desulfurase